MEKIGIDPTTLLMFVVHIHDHLNLSQPNPSEGYTPHEIPPIYFDPMALTDIIINAILSQEVIGWNHLLQGKMSLNWALAQEEYLWKEINRIRKQKINGQLQQ